MRILLTFIGCCITLVSLGQTIQQSLRIQITYEKPGHYLDQAVATIEAINAIGATTVVEYKAGHSITMLPGFEARLNSTFIAHIEQVSLENLDDTRLRLTAYPNPFEQSTTITYYLPTEGNVNLLVTDAQGKIISYLIQNETQTAGNHQVNWTPHSLSSGVYISIVEANQQKANARVIKK